MPETQSHRLWMSQTNSGNFIAICTCGWQGAIHIPPTHIEPKSKRQWRDEDRAQRNARDEHDEHQRAMTAGRVGG